MKQEGKVLSVCLITYNHGAYIRQAIEGVLMQKVNFSWELVIADDCSKDDTRKILLEYKEKYPEKIHLILQDKNVGPMKNWIDLISYPTSKYIAYFEGDDYWIDDLKLQKQVDFFEKNPEFSLSFHNVEVANMIEGYNYTYPTPPKEVLTVKDMLFKHYIPSCSIMFVREKLTIPFPQWFVSCKMGDIPMELMLADQGKVKYFPEKMGLYRKHGGGLTLNKEQIKAGRKAYLDVYRKLNKHFNYKYWYLFSVVINKVKLGYIKDWLGLNSVLKR